jgi:methyl-accepting chemotaxis protein
VLKWFVEIAPIRAKLLSAFGFFVSMVGTLAALNLILLSRLKAAAAGGGSPLAPTVDFAEWMAIGGAIATGCALIAGYAFRKMIADPYVDTVLDMEAIAAGDTERVIQRGHYRDCVGRLSRAMATFRDAAIEQHHLAERDSARKVEQDEVVRTLGEALRSLATGDIRHAINQPFPVEYEGLRADYNQARQGLNSALAVVAASAERIATGTSEIGSASDEIGRASCRERVS